jgi:hypothetical protein
VKQNDINHYWKGLKPYHKHIALMFHYRLKTETSDAVMNQYIETSRYAEFEIKTELLPDYIFKAKPRVLIQDAYEAIGLRYIE